jgi:hypothetical protein
MREKLRRILPWVVSIALLGYVFSRLELSDVLVSLRGAAGWTVPVLVLLTLFIYAADSLAIWATFAWFVARLPFYQVVVVRGATYLLALLHYALGQGAIVYFVNRARGVPVSRGTAAVLLVMGINILLLLMLASVGLLVAQDVPPTLRLIIMIGYAGLFAYTVLVAARPRFLASRPVLDVLLNAGLRGHLKAMAVRLPHLGAVIMLSYVALRGFGVEVPFTQAVLFLPIVWFVAMLPISALGLGTTQYFMKIFFARYAPGDASMQEAVVVTASLAYQAVVLIVQSSIGLVCLRSQLARQLDRPPEPAV